MMAAGVSINVCFLAEIVIFCVLCFTTNANRGVDIPYILQYSIQDTPFVPDHLVFDELRVQNLRFAGDRIRREAVGNTELLMPNISTTTIISKASTSPANHSAVTSKPVQSHTILASPPTLLPSNNATTNSTTTTITTTTQPTTATSTTPRPTTAENFTIIEEKDHKYYKSQHTTGTSYWLDEETLTKQGVKTHDTLSHSHRTAATVVLSFTFPFYGHEVRSITIATGGFLYVSDFLHQWLTATQYIAPLMANFDTRLGNDSYIHYIDNGTALVVWWENLYLQDLQRMGAFSFQSVIHNDGRIIFSYKVVPLAPSTIPEGQHPVKAGLSDAFYIDTTGTEGVKRRTIYEYQRLEIDLSNVHNETTVIITPLPTCVSIKTCNECLIVDIGFKCEWCREAGQCSDGYDRKRQQWLNHGCHEKEFQGLDECKPLPPTEPPVAQPIRRGPEGGALGIGGIIAILIVIIIIVVLTTLVVYGYLSPNSSVGLWLIEHRPSQIRKRLSNVRFWKRGEGNAEKYEVSMQSDRMDDGESIA